MKKSKLKSKAIKHTNEKNSKNNNNLYLKYIDTLVKSENLHNKLEKLYTNLMDAPNHLIRKKTNQINNNLNNVLVEVMLIQNLLNYVSAK